MADVALKHDVGEYGTVPVTASTTIYAGNMVGIVPATGYARGLNAGDIFAGHAREGIADTTGSAGGSNVTVLRGIYRLQVTITGVAVTDVGATVFGSAAAAYTLTAGANTAVGRVVRYVTTDTAVVEFMTCDQFIGQKLRTGKIAADKVYIDAFDIDATDYVHVITAAAHATVPQLTIGNSAGGTAIGFHGKTPCTQQAHIVDATTNPTDITTCVNAILVKLETLGLIATA